MTVCLLSVGIQGTVVLFLERVLTSHARVGLDEDIAPRLRGEWHGCVEEDVLYRLIESIHSNGEWILAALIGGGLLAHSLMNGTRLLARVGRLMLLML